MAVVLVCGAAALLHQARASAEAEAVRERGGSSMIQVRHLARCVSFSMPLAGSTAEDCLERGEAVITALRADGREEDARVASSALYGAIQSSFWETPALRAAKPSLGAAMLPAGATPVRMGSVISRVAALSVTSAVVPAHCNLFKASPPSALPICSQGLGPRCRGTVLPASPRTKRLIPPSACSTTRLANAG